MLPREAASHPPAHSSQTRSEPSGAADFCCGTATAGALRRTPGCSRAVAAPGGPKEAGLGAPGAGGASPGAAPLLPPAGAAAAVPGAAAASPVPAPHPALAAPHRVKHRAPPRYFRAP